MTELFHIVRKDLFRFRVQIGVLLFLTGIFAFYDIRSSPDNSTYALATLLRFVLLLSWWAMAAAVVQEEALAGDRQFWVTRPYNWKSLLGAKLLFIVLVVNGSLVVAGCFILGLQDFPVIASLPGLLLGQLLVVVFFILPAFLLATISRTVGQFTFFCALVLAVFLAEMAMPTTYLRPSTGLVSLAAPEPIWLFLLLPGLTIPVIIRQYARRRTEEDRVVVAAAALVFLPLLFFLPHKPWNAIRETVKPQIDVSRVALSLDLQRARTGGGYSQGEFVAVKLPVHVTGLPAAADLRGGSSKVQIKLADGSTLPHGYDANLRLDDDGYCATTLFSKSDFVRIANQPVTVHAAFTLTALSNRVTLRVPLGSREFHVPEFGICRVETRTLSCRQALWQPQWTDVWLEGAGVRSGVIPSREQGSWPVPLVWGSSPVTKWSVPLDAGIRNFDSVARDPAVRVVFVTRHRLAHFDRDLDAAGIRLADYEFDEAH